MLYQTVLVERSMMEKIPVEVADYEVPILKAVHGKNHVTILSQREVDIPKDEMPDMEQEQVRLARRYGNHPQTKVPYVEYVYGQDGLASYKPKRLKGGK